MKEQGSIVKKKTFPHNGFDTTTSKKKPIHLSTSFKQA